MGSAAANVLRRSHSALRLPLAQSANNPRRVDGASTMALARSSVQIHPRALCRMTKSCATMGSAAANVLSRSRSAPRLPLAQSANNPSRVDGASTMVLARSSVQILPRASCRMTTWCATMGIAVANVLRRSRVHSALRLPLAQSANSPSHVDGASTMVLARSSVQIHPRALCRMTKWYATMGSAAANVLRRSHSAPRLPLAQSASNPSRVDGASTMVLARSSVQILPRASCRITKWCATMGSAAANALRRSRVHNALRLPRAQSANNPSHVDGASTMVLARSSVQIHPLASCRMTKWCATMVSAAANALHQRHVC